MNVTKIENIDMEITYNAATSVPETTARGQRRLYLVERVHNSCIIRV